MVKQPQGFHVLGRVASRFHYGRLLRIRPDETESRNRDTPRQAGLRRDPLRKVILAAAVLLMAMDSTLAGTGAGIAVDPASGAVSFGGTLQEPAITSSPVPKH